MATIGSYYEKIDNTLISGTKKNDNIHIYCNYSTLNGGTRNDFIRKGGKKLLSIQEVAIIPLVMMVLI